MRASRSPNYEQHDEYDRLRRRVLWKMPYGLYVVGSTDGAERRNGMTINWVTQLSFDPKLIGVSIDAAGSGLDVQDFMRVHGMTYPVWLDPDDQFALKFLTIGVPETFVVDRAGVIRWRKVGALARGDTTLAAAIRLALGS